MPSLGFEVFGVKWPVWRIIVNTPTPPLKIYISVISTTIICCQHGRGYINAQMLANYPNFGRNLGCAWAMGWENFPKYHPNFMFLG